MEKSGPVLKRPYRLDHAGETENGQGNREDGMVWYIHGTNGWLPI